MSALPIDVQIAENRLTADLVQKRLQECTNDIPSSVFFYDNMSGIAKFKTALAKMLEHTFMKVNLSIWCLHLQLPSRLLQDMQSYISHFLPAAELAQSCYHQPSSCWVTNGQRSVLNPQSSRTGAYLACQAGVIYPVQGPIHLLVLLRCCIRDHSGLCHALSTRLV